LSPTHGEDRPDVGAAPAAPTGPDRAMVDGDGMRHGERALVLHPAFKMGPRAQYSGGRSPETRLEEAIGLARAIDLNVIAGEIVRISEPKPGTLIGSGGVDRLAALVADQQIGVVVIDGGIAGGIHEEVVRRNADLVVVGRGHDQGIVSRVWSRLYSVVRDSPCPVLSI